MTSPTLAELTALPESSVIIDADGLAKQKHNGRWMSWFDRDGSSSKRMLNPDAARQPLRIIYAPTPRTCAWCDSGDSPENRIGLGLCRECKAKQIAETGA